MLASFTLGSLTELFILIDATAWQASVFVTVSDYFNNKLLALPTFIH
jgi:hypothetical protein